MTEASPARKVAATEEKAAGQVAFQRGFFETAAWRFTRAIDLDPAKIFFLVSRAKAYYHMHDYAACIRDCDEAVKRGRELCSRDDLIKRAALQWKGKAHSAALRAVETGSSETEQELREGLDQQAADEHR